MRKRFNIIAVAVVLAIGSFVFARYDYANKNTARITSDIKVENPFQNRELFGSWMKDEMVFAIILPVIFLAGGAAWALKK